MEERMTLCNMVIEAGGKNGVVPADSTTYKYLEVRAVDHKKQFKIWCQICNKLCGLDLDNLHVNRVGSVCLLSAYISYL